VCLVCNLTSLFVAIGMAVCIHLSRYIMHSSASIFSCVCMRIVVLCLSTKYSCMHNLVTGMYQHALVYMCFHYIICMCILQSLFICRQCIMFLETLRQFFFLGFQCNEMHARRFLPRQRRFNSLKSCNSYGKCAVGHAIL
jgi:hypothetical protein